MDYLPENVGGNITIKMDGLPAGKCRWKYHNVNGWITSRKM
jgi:hypothetical protein